MTAATVTNSAPPRKQLCDQLDRLDGILDALSEGLNGAVADAAREGTRLAVKDAIVEIMTDPALRAKLHEATALVQPAKKPGFWARLKAGLGRAATAASRAASAAGAGAANGVRAAVDGATGAVRAVTEGAAEAVRSLQHLGSVKSLILVGLGVGLALGAASFMAPHAVAAAVSGVSGAVAAAAVQIGTWTRRAFRTLTMA